MRFMFAALALFAGLAHAQIEIGTGNLPANNSPSLVMPAGKIYVDTSTIPPRQAARAEKRARVACTGVYDVAPCNTVVTVPERFPYDGPGGFDAQIGGSFRVICNFSHMTFDDPIVWPGQSGRTHIHQFFGNDSTRASTDLDNMATSGKSTCHGGTLNRSGYWSPVPVYHCPVGQNAIYGCTEARDGEIFRPIVSNFYYKRTGLHASSGGYGGTAVVWPPAGFRMISGRAANTLPMAGDQWQIHCQDRADTGFDHFPTVAEINAAPVGSSSGGECREIKMRVAFNSCWDGIDIDGGPFHDEHVGPFQSALGCNDPDFPILFPEITANFHFLISNADLQFVRLSSDLPRAEAALLAHCTSANNYCAGRSLHADWVNGWDATPNGDGTYAWGGLSITDIILKECYMLGVSETAVLGVSPVHSNCHDDLLGAPLSNGTSTNGGGGSLAWWIMF